MQALYEIANHTFKECLRQPIFIVVQLTSLFIIGLHPVFALFAFREQQKLVTDGSLATILVFGCVAAVICAGNTIHNEIANGTALLILSKPVSRPVFIMAKISAVSATLMLFAWNNGIATLLAVRIAKYQFNLEHTIFFLYFLSIVLACTLGAMANFLNHACFSYVASIALALILSLVMVIVYWLPEHNGGYQWGKHIGYSRNLVSAIILLMLAIIMMGAVATSLSVCLSHMANMLGCGIIFFAGLISDYIHYKVTYLSREKLTQLMVFWPFYLIPLIIIFWVLSLRAAYKRNQGIVLYNVVWGAIITGLIVWGGYAKINRAELRPPSVTTKFLAEVAYLSKDFISETFHAIVPNWQLFWMADALAAGTTISGTYMGYGCVYTLCFMVVFSGVAVLLFTFREIGQQLPR